MKSTLASLVVLVVLFLAGCKSTPGHLAIQLHVNQGDVVALDLAVAASK
jgi:starvation-inducible outer membrane lipoprotein